MNSIYIFIKSLRKVIVTRSELISYFLFKISVNLGWKVILEEYNVCILTEAVAIPEVDYQRGPKILQLFGIIHKIHLRVIETLYNLIYLEFRPF